MLFGRYFVPKLWILKWRRESAVKTYNALKHTKAMFGTLQSFLSCDQNACLSTWCTVNPIVYVQNVLTCISELLPQQGPLQFQPTTGSPPQYDHPRQHGQHPKQSPPEQALLPSQHFQTQQPPPTQQGQPSQHGQLPQHGQPSQQFPPGQDLVPSQQFQTQQPPPTLDSQPPHISQQQYPSSHGPQPHPAPQTQGPPPQQNIPAQGPPPQNYQPPQYGQGLPSQPPSQPPGPPSMQYQNQPADPSYQQNLGDSPLVEITNNPHRPHMEVTNKHSSRTDNNSIMNKM